MHDLKALKAKIDLVELLTHHGLALKRRGKNLFALCPFHRESTPSFSVNAKLGLWHCFGCDAGGDVFSFVQRLEHLTFPQTVKKLAGWTSTSTDRR
jgi:DNA primase